MTTLQVKTKIPNDRHITLDLDLSNTVQPGEAEILLVIENAKNENNNQKLTKKQLIQKLSNGPVWSEEDLTGFWEFRKEISKWQPDEY